jgi:hypothetical protein
MVEDINEEIPVRDPPIGCCFGAALLTQVIIGSCGQKAGYVPR